MTMLKSAIVGVGFAFALACAVFGPVAAHETEPARAKLHIAEDGVITLALTFDIERYVTGADPGHRSTMRGPSGDRYRALRRLQPEALSAEIAAGDMLHGAVVITGETGAAVPMAVVRMDVPAVGNPRRARRSTAMLSSSAPVFGPISLAFDNRVGDVILKITTPDGSDPTTAYVAAGQSYGPIRVRAAGL